MASQTTQAISSGDLVDLVSSSGQATIYPSDDAILAVLQARFRADLPYTRLGNASIVVVNPYKTLANVNDVSAREYEDRCYKDTSLPMVDSPKPLQPHLYDLASRLYLLMRRRNISQAVVTRGITASGKSSSMRLLTNQILLLSSHSKKERKVAEQIKSFCTVLDAFGNAKTFINPNASRHSRYLELHFSNGRISGAKILAYNLDKSRLARLAYEERTYHVFYQLLSGATTHERDAYNLEDVSDYALLASSGCYRLPSGPFSDDSIAFGDLKNAMRALSFKPKQLSSIFTLLTAILTLGNLQFTEADFHDVAAYVVNTPVLDTAARLLGVSSEDLTQVLTNKTSYVRKELYTTLMNAEQSRAQRDVFVRDLYAILFAYVVETANHRLAPKESTTQIALFDQPGFQTRSPSGGSMPLVSTHGHNTFDEFSINFTDELLHSFVTLNTFDDNVGYSKRIVADGLGESLPSISNMDNSGCVELLRGTGLNDERWQKKPGGLLGILNKGFSAFKNGKCGDDKNAELLTELNGKFSTHSSYIAENNRNMFGINHYAGPASYDVTSFIEKDADLLDSAFVTLLRASEDSFVAKLFSGPSLAVEKHSKDESIIVQAQVSSKPLRQPSLVALEDESEEERTLKEELELNQARTDKVFPCSTQSTHILSTILSSLTLLSTRSPLHTITCIRPNDSSSPNSFDKRRVKAQIRALLLPEIVARKSTEWVVDMELGEFCDRFVPTMRGSTTERVTQCARANGWLEGVDFGVGRGRVWLGYKEWKIVEDGVRTAEKEERKKAGIEEEDSYTAGHGDDAGTDYTHQEGGYEESVGDSLLNRGQGQGQVYGAMLTPNVPHSSNARGFTEEDGGAWGSERSGPDEMEASQTNVTTPAGQEGLIVQETSGNTVEAIPSTRSRRLWLFIVWASTWLIPSFLLKHVGRMKRPDIQLAWREKVTIVWLIFLLNALIIFYIVIFGRLLCPEFNSVYGYTDVAGHTASNDFWVTIQGRVYDVSNFVNGDHSSAITNIASNTADVLEVIAGQDLTYYFPPPLALGCSGLVDDPNLLVTYKNFTNLMPNGEHFSGAQNTWPSGDTKNEDWYKNTFLTKMNQFYKGPLVIESKALKSQAASIDDAKIWAVYQSDIFDLTDYFNTITTNPATPGYVFLNTTVTDLFKERAGQDITKVLGPILDSLGSEGREQHLACLKNVFYVGKVDVRKTPRCSVQNYFLLVAAGILMASMGLKFLAALQFGSARVPELQDKFVLCQVPCYTEGEESLRRTIDSLAALNYDDKRKLIFIICDGNIIGSGNEKTTPAIVLDILGIDPKLEPEPLLFKSIGEGSKALNYAKIYSGLYEFEGHVVPYMVVVKVGKPTERSKPGNRGKRDSQILLMHYLNRVHFNAPMSPMELEIYHQMRNVIGIDPAFYEYIFTVDADTTVTPDALNRLVASSADDSSIIGICGETKLENEDVSWWTMIQVYEYYISHHLSKAFESLFGSVTCLPGCFTLYRIRTADKGRPIIISNRIIDEYSEPNVDTLHKKNLFSLGEDRFLTTLLMKHFPTFKTKFNPDALARTVAPEAWRVLFSQRRRWINSTVHNLCELVMLPELFGFCCFSMRFFVFIDLLGTLILPATCVYLVYLIITVSIGAAPIPQLALIMLGITYGLQALIFLLKREFMLIGWLIVYIISYPVYSFFLPIYSFWCMDEFGWGNTRLVVGEGKDKKIMMAEDEKFDDSMIPLKKFSDYEAEAWETRSRHSDETGYESKSQSRSRPPGSGDQSPRSYNQASQSGDYYRDTNLRHNGSNPNLRLGQGSQLSHSNMSFHGDMNQPPMMPQYSGQHLPFMPFAAGPGSAAGSDYGGQMMPQMYQNTGSVYGMMPPQMPQMGPMFTGGSFGGSQVGGYAPPPVIGGGMGAPRMSTFSIATTANPFAGPSTNANPTDEELFQALRNYLSTQDLMTVTKKTAREAIVAKFPSADLAPRKDYLNQSIDKILSET